MIERNCRHLTMCEVPAIFILTAPPFPDYLNGNVGLMKNTRSVARVIAV